VCTGSSVGLAAAGDGVAGDVEVAVGAEVAAGAPQATESKATATRAISVKVFLTGQVLLNRNLATNEAGSSHSDALRHCDIT
jgi:hypothetical protein